MIYDSDMEVRGEQQVVTGAMISVLHYKSVLDTDSSHGVTTASIFTLARLLDTGNNLSDQITILTFISSLLMLVLSKLISTEYLVGIMWL